MSKKVVLGVAAGCVAAAVIAANKKGTAGPRPAVWEKMRQRMEAMPEDFPPRVMFDNVAAIRANTDRIREILESSSLAPEVASDEIEVVETT